MESWEREYHVARIVASETPVWVRGERVVVGNPDRSARLRAAEVYRDVWRECHLNGVMDEVEAMVLLQDRGLWMPEDEKKRVEIVGKIDDLKVGLFEGWSRSNERIAIRYTLGKIRDELSRLDERKHRLDHATCEGVALAGRYRYLVGCSIRREDGSPHWDVGGWDRPDDVIEDVMDELARVRLSEADYRELARTEPWRSVWQSREAAGRGVFDGAAVDLSHEQSYLASWANLYGGIRESDESPDEEIISDDDMLDGWLIRKKRERDARRARKMGEEIGNEKIRNSGEVFILADTVDDARKIDGMNSTAAAMIKQQRLAHLRSKGTVPETQMPDTWMRMQGEASRMASERMRGDG